MPAVKDDSISPSAKRSAVTAPATGRAARNASSSGSNSGAGRSAAAAKTARAQHGQPLHGAAKANNTGASKAGGARKGAAKSGTAGPAAKATAAGGNPILEASPPQPMVQHHGEMLLDERSAVANQAAKVIAEVVLHRPELLNPAVDKIAQGLLSPHRKVVQTSADALPVLAKLAPARVARQLDRLKATFKDASLAGQDGMVRTFAALCSASVAYQKRLEPVLTEALGKADPKAIQRWTETILPSLKGEPHARARAVVEGRLSALPRPVAQKIADYLGIKLRPKTMIS